MDRSIVVSGCAMLLIASALGCSSNGRTTGLSGSSIGHYKLVPHPRFPGAGESGADVAIDPGEVMSCFYGGAKTTPAATIEHVVEVFQEQEAIHVRITLDPDFVDNTYGQNSIGWSARRSGHSYKDLVGSDHAELVLHDAAGKLTSDFKLDYISADTTVNSMYQNLGVLGGDGKMITGKASDVLATRTSLDRNLNERGYGSYIVDSPKTDASYTPNPATPKWDYRVVYEAWVKKSAFGSAGFGKADLTFIHASPSKVATNSVTVTEKPCPSDWFDQVCDTPDGCPKPGSGSGTSDTTGTGAGTGTGGDSSGGTTGTGGSTGTTGTGGGTGSAADGGSGSSTPCEVDGCPTPAVQNGAGGSCTWGGDCLSANCTGGTCAPGAEGTPCSVNADCANGAQCLSGSQVCGFPTLLGAGGACTANAQCASNSCAGGKCQLSAPGYACTGDADCTAGYSCTDGYCHDAVN